MEQADELERKFKFLQQQLKMSNYDSSTARQASANVVYHFPAAKSCQVLATNNRLQALKSQAKENLFFDANVVFARLEEIATRDKREEGKVGHMWVVEKK